MDGIFLKESQNFIKTLNKYIQQEASYKDLTEANLRLEAASFPILDKELIHNFKLEQYKKAQEFERNILQLEEKLSINSLNYGLYIGATKKNDYGNHLPPYPMLNMIMKEQEEVKEEVEEEVFDFEF